MKKISILLVSLSILFTLSGSLIYAADDGTDIPDDNTGSPTINATLNNPFRGGDDLFTFLKTVINNILMPIGGVLAVLAFIYTGFLYVTAQGNATKLATAHKALLYTSIGTAILLGSWVLANVICATIGQLGGPICPSGNTATTI